MTAGPSDPLPEDSPGLEEGGSVRPGDTPPAEASTTQGVSTPMPPLPSERSNRLVVGVIAGLTVLVAVAVFGSRLVGLW